MSNKDKYFYNDEHFYYFIKDNNLYYNNYNLSIKVTNLPVDNIVYYDNNICYFISKDTLYKVDINKGIKAIASYSEWKYNNMNIYVF